MARDDLIQATGTVDKILGGGRYQITLENGKMVTAQLSGRMRRFRIRVIPGDRVQVGVSPYDPTHGFVTFRLREMVGSRRRGIEKPASQSSPTRRVGKPNS